MASSSIFFLLFFSLAFVNILDAIVPPSDTFQYVNQGDFGENDVEYNPTYRPLPPFTFPFQLCFYNTTPNAYTLALRMGSRRDRTMMRWVWEANRGRPVRENATLSFGSDGNLVLAEADGQIAWQTNTANKGVVAFAIQSDGNIVLRDSNGTVVWQSFDYPTDTLLVGQTLRPKGRPQKLVSRDSITNNVNGVYSFVIEPRRIALYYKNNMRYWSPPYPVFNEQRRVFIENVTLRNAETEYEGNNFFTLGFTIANAEPPYEFPSLNLGTDLFNSSLAYFRLGIDGNIRFYSYRPNVRFDAWILLYTLFDRRVTMNGLNFEDECQLPNRCGKFGLCEDSQCVGCPTPNGVVAWSKDCDSKVPGCNASGFRYYELKGVDHFTVKYTPGSGPVKQSDCESKCTKDCKCMGYFYRTDTSRCWTVNELKTLTRVGNSTHLAYIKTPIGR